MYLVSLAQHSAWLGAAERPEKPSYSKRTARPQPRYMPACGAENGASSPQQLIPVDLDYGTVSTVESVVVTDTFGLRTLIQPGITTRRTIGLGGGGRRAGAGVDAAAEFVRRMSDLAVVLGSRRMSDSQRRISASTAGVLADRWTPTRPSGPSGRCAGGDASSGAGVCCSTAAGYEELVWCMATPGVAWPPKDWAATWERVRAERPRRWPGSASAAHADRDGG